MNTRREISRVEPDAMALRALAHPQRMRMLGLLRVEGPGATMPSLPAPLFAGARQVGELRTAVTTAAGATIGLAMLSLLHVQAGTSLAFSADGPTQLRLIAIP